MGTRPLDLIVFLTQPDWVDLKIKNLSLTRKQPKNKTKVKKRLNIKKKVKKLLNKTDQTPKKQRTLESEPMNVGSKSDQIWSQRRHIHV